MVKRVSDMKEGPFLTIWYLKGWQQQLCFGAWAVMKVFKAVDLLLSSKHWLLLFKIV